MTSVVYVTVYFTGPPANVLLSASSQGLIMSWDLPFNFSEERHGMLIAYTVKCYSEGETVSIYELQHETQVSMTDFLPNEAYNCCVSLQTSLAVSPHVCHQQTTPEDGNQM